MTRLKPAEIRFYIDADVLGLAHVLARLRPDVTYPGDPGAVIQKRTTALPDHEHRHPRSRLDSGRGGAWLADFDPG